MTKDKEKYKVVIIGGGPAGIATSITLSARGVSNCIIEAQVVPQKKLGEAIPPNAKPLLKKLGIAQLLQDERHTVYYGNKSCWGSNELEQKEFIKGIYGYGYLLDRLLFEKQLRDHVITTGGHFFAGYKLKKVNKGITGIQVDIDTGKEVVTLHPKYIVDATGRKASVCNQLRVRKYYLDTQFSVTIKASVTKPISHNILVEATKNGWWYVAPDNQTEVTLMFFTLQELVPDKKEMSSFLRNELISSIHLAKIIEISNLCFNDLKIMPAGTSCLAIPYGDHWIAVGDAAYSYDPISSYGITSALASGFYGGHAIASALSNQENAMATYRYILENTFKIYKENLVKHYALENRWQNNNYWNHRFHTKTATTTCIF